MGDAVRRIPSVIAVICLVAATAMAAEPHPKALPTDDDVEDLIGIPTEGPTEGLLINKAQVGKVDVQGELQGKIKDNRLVIVATSEFFKKDPGFGWHFSEGKFGFDNEKLVVEYVLDGKKKTIELSAIPGDTLGVDTPGADWGKGVAVLGAN